jgi:cell division GTPase FtsZ
MEEEMDVGMANIKVIGAGGAGSNMVNWLYHKGIQGAEIVACNTDALHLKTIEADRKFLIGKELTKGLGCGGFPQRGAEAAKESIKEIKDALKALTWFLSVLVWAAELVLDQHQLLLRLQKRTMQLSSELLLCHLRLKGQE